MVFRFHLIVIMLFSISLIFINCSQEEKKARKNHGKLGQVVQISISVNDISTVQSFYENLGFQEIEGRESGKNPWKLLSDGTINIVLSNNSFPSPALTYFSNNLKKRVEYLDEKGIQLNKSPQKNGSLSNAVLFSPEGIGITLINFNSESLPSPGRKSTSKIGQFDEFSIPTKNLESSLKFWQQVGFSIQSRGESPYPWIKLSDGLVTIGLHQTKDFQQQAISYFSKNLSEKMNLLKNKNLPFEVLTLAGKKKFQVLKILAPNNEFVMVFEATG